MPDTIITVVGNLTADPELRYTQSGLAVANFTIASTPRTFDRAANEWKDGEALFLRASCWREFAEHVAGSGSEGVVVVDIDQNGLAFEHGFKTGDVILDVGGKKVATPGDVRDAVKDAHKDGKRVVMMRLKSDEATRFVAVPLARA